MAYRLRHISNKFPAFSSKVIQNNHVISFEQNPKHYPVSCKYKNLEECSNPLKLNDQCRASSTILKSYLHNGERPSDIVIKENCQLVDYNDRCNVLRCTPTLREDVPTYKGPSASGKSMNNFSGKPSPDKLQYVHDSLKTSLPKVFYGPMDLSIYHLNVVFENNIKGVTTVGILDYKKQWVMLRTVGHFKFAYVRFEVIKITKHDEDSTIRVRWRIRGITVWQAMVLVWKLKLQQIREHLEATEAWYDGFSTFYVNSDGVIVKHVADKMQPDSNSVSEKLTTPLENAKLAMVMPKVSL